MSSHYSSMEEDHQLLSFTKTHHHHHPPSLDLQLSISVTPLKPINMGDYSRRVEVLKWEAAEQIRLAAMEKAYAEHLMEMTRREMEVAQSEFLTARTLWDRAREDLDRANKMRERATTNISTCMEITCISCTQKFTP